MLEIDSNLLDMLIVFYPEHNLDLPKLEKLKNISEYNHCLIQELLDSWNWEIENISMIKSKSYVKDVFPYEWLDFLQERIKYLNRQTEFLNLFILLNNVLKN